MKRLNKDTYEKLWESVTQHWDAQLLEAEGFDPQQANREELKHEIRQLINPFQRLVEDWTSHIERFIEPDMELMRRQGGAGDDSEIEQWTDQDHERLMRIKSMIESIMSTENGEDHKVDIDMGPAYG
jgi:hypothetical protein